MKPNSALSLLSATLLTLSLISLSTSAVAYNRVYKGEAPRYYKDMPPETCGGEEGLMDGLYLGLGVGYDAYKVRTSASFSDPSGGTFSADPEQIAKGFDGSLFLGYGQYFDWFYIAGEIFAKISDASSSFSATSPDANFNSQIDINQTYGISVLPGVKVNDMSLFYLRLGYARTWIKTQENGVSGLGSFSDSDTNWTNGIATGLGIETLLYENLSLRGEYVYTSYNSFTTDAVGTRFSPSDNEFTLGLLYHFNFG